MLPGSKVNRSIIIIGSSLIGPFSPPETNLLHYRINPRHLVTCMMSKCQRTQSMWLVLAEAVWDVGERCISYMPNRCVFSED